ncbi:MAG: VOC family protein [Actinobacteria bacterium]|nr:VOC family protein [Actinomycetota bacterium]
MGEPRRIDYAILYVEDLEASVRFYRDVVGLPFKFAAAGYAEFATEGTRFALLDRRLLPDLIGLDPRRVLDGAGEAGVVPRSEVAILVEDVDVEADRLREAGVRVLFGPVDRSWGHRTLHVADPDGHVLELAQEIPRSIPRA